MSSVYLPSRHAFPAHPPEALGWLCRRRCCRPGSSGLPGKGICSQCPGSRQGRRVQTEAACHLESAGIHQEPAAPWLWQFCPLRGEMLKLKHQIWLHGTQKPTCFFLLLPQRQTLYLLYPMIQRQVYSY